MSNTKNDRRFNFTKKAIEDLATPDPGKRVHYFDQQVSGLGIAVYSSGRRMFFHLKKVNGWPRHTTLAQFPDLSIEQARGKASELNAAIAKWKQNNYEGADPFEPRAQVPTFGELETAYIDRHLKQHAKHPEKAVRSTQLMIAGYIASWRGRRLNAIRRQDVLDLHMRLGSENGQIAANRVCQLLRRMFYFANEAGLFSGENPARKVKFFHEQKRTRFLNADELARLFAALRKDPSQDFKDFVLLALFTGARKSDVMSMAWADISLPDNKWTIPNPKNRQLYLVPLAPEAVTILKKRRNGSPWVFPSHGSTGHVIDLKSAWKKLLERAQIDDLRQHDLRRTLGSWQASQGSSLKVIGASLGHESVAATQVYAQLDLSPIRRSVLSATRAMVAASKKKPKRKSKQLPAAGAA